MIISDIPAVKVNNRPIDAEQISAEIQYHPAGTRREATVKAARALIINEVVRQRAVSVGLWPTDKLLESHQEEPLIEQLIARDAHLPKASEEDCRQFFGANQQRFASAPLLEVRHILLAADPKDADERANSRELADQLLILLQQNQQDFAELARSHSQCPSAKVGGNLGQISKGQTVPEFERQLFAAPKGLMNTPVETRYGFHLVEIVRRVEGHPLPYEQVRGDIRRYLDAKVRRKTIAQYLTCLLSEADIQGFDFGLEGSPLMQ
ncbi:peptidylprolyl isomerase [Bowmanella dokdonensis]|uniref:peptidylprolyl isomerase n=1 Tax=Bowmanella dokdonensis TaxID=751969 RepID=A0A939DKQ2_9ALTE|nr:peptidylprolyl isomerase [Bowmanella dokdonensis]MBN7824345.1 peptidylprolyl isomerase [Bowmanella dokdonensis]